MTEPAMAVRRGRKPPRKTGDPTSGAARPDSTNRPVVAVANRLPVQQGDDGGWELSPGGLVTALRPVMATRRGAWVGWDGGTRGMPQALPDSSIQLMPIGLSSAQVRGYYHGFANATLWPLLHNSIEKPRLERAWWFAYRDVNAIFAERVVAALDAEPDALAWVHDYHLMLVPQLIRARRPEQPVGFFLHVPWPSPDIFARLPWREQILTGLLGADVVSFHTDEHRGNFLRSCARLLSDSGIEVRRTSVVMPDGRVVFLQVAVPSRDDVREYRQLRSTVEQHIGRINGKFTVPGGDVPVHYLYRSLSQQQLAAYYAIADALLVTPLIDGMNLVCKEYVTVQQARRGSGVLVLSEFTGAAVELPQAVLCNPFDVEGLSFRIEQALRLSDTDRRSALGTMAERVRTHDVHRWVTGQLTEIAARGRARG